MTTSTSRVMSGRDRWSRGALVVAGLVVAGLIVAACGGGSDAAPRATTGAAASSPGSVSPVADPQPPLTSTPEESTGSTLPADGIGVTRVVRPVPDALVLDERGRPVAGDQLLVVVDPAFGPDVPATVAAALGGEVVGLIEMIDLWQVGIPSTDAAGLARAIETASGIEGVVAAMPNEAATLDEEVWGTPMSPLDDPVYAGEHGAGYRLIGVEQAWTYLRGSGLELNPVHVGVVDNGVYTGTGEFDDHPIEETVPGHGVLGVPNDLERIGADGSRTVIGPNPAGSHGTGVTSIIGADADDGGVVGVASIIPGLTLTSTDIYRAPYGSGVTEVPPELLASLPEDDRVTLENGVSFTSGDFLAIADQIRRGARVINMSWGNSDSSTATATLYRRFFEQMARRHPEVLFVGSAGNSGRAQDGEHRFPSGAPWANMITVGNVNDDGTTHESSNRSSDNFEVTLAAPGHQAVQGVGPDGTVLAGTYPLPGGAVDGGGGTSMAAPQVTAAAALLLAVDPTLSAADVKALLVRTARSTVVRDDGSEQRVDEAMGAGVLAVDRAVAAIIAERRAELGLQPAELTVEQLAQLGAVQAVARSTDGTEWTVTATVAACHAPCTDVTIELQGSGAVGGSTLQTLTAAGDVSWSVSLPERPATLVVRRSDNQAGSRILIDRLGLDGRWTGEYWVDSMSGNGISLPEPALWATVDATFTATADGTYTGTFTGTLLDGSVEELPVTATVSGGRATVMFDGVPVEGPISVGADGSVRFAGSFAAETGGVASTGRILLTRVGP